MPTPDQESADGPAPVLALLNRLELAVDTAAKALDRDPDDPALLTASPSSDDEDAFCAPSNDDDMFASSGQQAANPLGKTDQNATTDDNSDDSSLNDFPIPPYDGADGPQAPGPKSKQAPAAKGESLAARRARADRERTTAFPEHCVSLNRQVAWFDDDSITPRPVPMHGMAANFTLAPDQNPDGETVTTKARSSALNAARYPFNNVWASLLCHIGIFEIEGPHGDRYLCWLLRTTAKQDTLWRSIQSDTSLLSFWTVQHSQLATSAQPVYVEKLNGGPLGSYAGALASDKRRVPSLFVQMYGFRNAVPCESCERNYRRNVNPGVTPGSSDQNPVRVMSPFFECISLPGFSHGVCGNCLFAVNGANCSFHSKPPSGAPAPWVVTKRASLEVEGRLAPRRLSLTATPIKGQELGAPLLRQKTLNAKGRQWMGNQATFGRTVDWEGGVPTSSTGAADQTPGTFNTTPKASPVNTKGLKAKSARSTPNKTPTKNQPVSPTDAGKDKGTPEVTSTSQDATGLANSEGETSDRPSEASTGDKMEIDPAAPSAGASSDAADQTPDPVSNGTADTSTGEDANMSA